MKFLCLAYEEERKLHALTPGEWDSLRRETLTYVDEMRKAGQLVSAEPLQSARTAATIRIRDGKLTRTDGPFAETKEQLGGFFLVNARDMNEALEIASKWPSARIGTIEVRPLEDGLPLDTRYH